MIFTLPTMANTALEKEPIYNINGTLVPKSKAVIPVTDLGILRGDGVFDFWVTYPHHRSLSIEHQLERLRKSASLTGLAFPWVLPTLVQEIATTLEANEHIPGEKALRYVLTGGIGPDSVTRAETPTRILYIEPHKPYPQELYEQGAKAITHKFTRYEPGAKTTNYIEAVKQTQIAREQGAIEVVYYSGKQVFEGATSNVYIVKDGKIITPHSNVLPGVTRRFILEDLDLLTQVTDFKIKDLRNADEVFLSASNKLIMPITVLDNQSVGNRKVGPVTQEVMRQFNRFIQN